MIQGDNHELPVFKLMPYLESDWKFLPSVGLDPVDILHLDCATARFSFTVYWIFHQNINGSVLPVVELFLKRLDLPLLWLKLGFKFFTTNVVLLICKSNIMHKWRTAPKAKNNYGEYVLHLPSSCACCCWALAPPRSRKATARMTSCIIILLFSH